MGGNVEQEYIPGQLASTAPEGPTLWEYQDLWFKPGMDWKQAISILGAQGWKVVHLFQFTSVQQAPAPLLAGLPPIAPQQTIQFTVAGALLGREIGPWSVRDVVSLVSEQPTENEALERANAVLAGLSFPDPDKEG